MPHHPKPWFRPSRNRWFVEIDGKQYNLGPDERQRSRRCHAPRGTRPREKPEGTPPGGAPDPPLAGAKENKPPPPYEWSQRPCEASARPTPPLLVGGPAQEAPPD